MKNGMPIVIAHRGAMGEAPENTLAAFELALEQGCDAFELDVHLSADGEIMVIHDYTVNRTSNGEGAVRDLTARQLQSFDAGSWFDAKYKGEKIPTLEEVLDLSPEYLTINVEIKGSVCEGIEERLVELLRKKNWTSRIVVSSFHYQSLEKLNRLEPSLRTGLLYSMWLKDHTLLPQAAGVTTYSLHPHYKQLNADSVKSAVAAGLEVYAWTVNAQEDMVSILDMGVTGIITDYPGKLRQMLGSKMSV